MSHTVFIEKKAPEYITLSTTITFDDLVDTLREFDVDYYITDDNAWSELTIERPEIMRFLRVSKSYKTTRHIQTRHILKEALDKVEDLKENPATISFAY